MANNRLYIVDSKTGEACFLAKAMGDGWYTTQGLEDALYEFFNKKDPDTGKPIDWECSAGMDGFSTRLLLCDESTYDPSGMAADKRRIVNVISSALRGNK